MVPSLAPDAENGPSSAESRLRWPECTSNGTVALRRRPSSPCTKAASQDPSGTLETVTIGHLRAHYVASERTSGSVRVDRTLNATVPVELSLAGLHPVVGVLLGVVAGGGPAHRDTWVDRRFVSGDLHRGDLHHPFIACVPDLAITGPRSWAAGLLAVLSG
jgi:hypothetical protein